MKFNLQKFLKKAFYDDGKGLIQNETRSMMNCYKQKLDSGASAHEAWFSCKDEFQTLKGGNWKFDYASGTATKK